MYIIIFVTDCHTCPKGTPGPYIFYHLPCLKPPCADLEGRNYCCGASFRYIIRETYTPHTLKKMQKK